MVFCNQESQEIKKCPVEDFGFRYPGHLRFSFKIICCVVAGTVWQAMWPEFMLSMQGQGPTLPPALSLNTSTQGASGMFVVTFRVEFGCKCLIKKATDMLWAQTGQHVSGCRWTWPPAPH